jgi:heat shock protein HslJ
MSVEPTALAALAMVTALTACSVGGSGATAAPPLAGTTWILASLPGRTLVPQAMPSLAFGAGDRATGSDGCNRYGATYRASGAALTVTPGGATMMACAEPVMEQARAFMSALSATRSHALVGGQLLLRDDAGTVIATLAPMQPAALPGSRWSATAVNNGKEAIVSLLAGTEITAEFGSDGALAGSAGCNRYTARYTLDRERVSITPPALTRRACEPDVMQQEQDYTAALARVFSYRLDVNRLELRSADGALQVSFEPRP